MMTLKQLLIVWAPRVLGLALAVFMTLFAFDGFQQGKPLGAALAEFVMQLLVPGVLVAIVVLSWRRPWIGGVAFVLLGALYAVSAWSRPDWVLAISGPLLAVGALFFWSGRVAVHGSGL
jgi:hypothetical protein